MLAERAIQKIAQEHGVPYGSIIRDSRELNLLRKVRPRTLKELRMVRSFGPPDDRVDKYGKELLKAINVLDNVDINPMPLDEGIKMSTRIKANSDLVFNYITGLCTDTEFDENWKEV